MGPLAAFCRAQKRAIGFSTLFISRDADVDALAHQPPQMAKTNGIELCYETFGVPDAEPLILIMGLGAQMIHWDDEFCRELAARGFRVIRFDNRDIGHSTKMSGGKCKLYASPSGDAETATKDTASAFGPRTRGT